MLCVDVEVNPGPVSKFPCRRCGKAVRWNQRGVECDGCDNWHHPSCINMPASEYLSLSESNVSWFCPACVSDELPFANCSASDLSLDEENLITDSSHPSLFDISQSSSPLSSCTNKAVFCHLIVQCLRNKIDELRSTYGIRDAELAWFADYMSGRKQRVLLNNVPSE